MDSFWVYSGSRFDSTGPLWYRRLDIVGRSVERVFQQTDTMGKILGDDHWGIPPTREITAAENHPDVTTSRSAATFLKRKFENWNYNRTPDPIEPTRRGPGPNRPTGVASGRFSLGGNLRWGGVVSKGYFRLLMGNNSCARRHQAITSTAYILNA